MTHSGFCPSCGMTAGAAALRCGNCGAMLPPGEEAGDVRRVAQELAEALGAGYEVVEEIGRGGFARVFRIRDRQLDRWLAAKVILPELMASPETRERFRREAMTVVRLVHPNIVPIYFVPASGRLSAYVMPLIDGESLAARVSREGALPLPVAAGIVHDVACALDAAHALHVVHRDVKPDNILLETQTGRALLTDFGIARAPSAADRLTATGQVLGTPFYLSPEQASGDRAVDGRSDVYSLGVVAFEMVAGRVPFEAASAQALFAMHVAAPCPDVRQFRAEASAGLAAALERAMAKEPDARFDSAGEFDAAFAAGLARRSLRTSSASVLERMPAADVGLFRTASPVSVPDAGAAVLAATDLGALRDGLAAARAGLAQALREGNVRRAAEAVAALAAGARDARPAFRQEIVSTLEDWAKEAALVASLAQLWARPEPGSQELAERALGALMPHAGPGLLALARRDRRADLVLLADRTGALGQDEALALVRDPSPSVAGLLLGVLVESQRPPEVIERWLTAAARHGSAEVRRMALIVAAQRGGALAEHLGRLGLGDRDGGVRIAALDALGASERKEVVPDLARVLQASDSDEQIRAAQALGQVGAREAVAALERAVTRRRLFFFAPTAAEEAALDALTRIRHPDAGEALERIAGRSGPMRDVAARAVAARREPRPPAGAA